MIEIPSENKVSSAPRGLTIKTAAQDIRQPVDNSIQVKVLCPSCSDKFHLRIHDFFEKIHCPECDFAFRIPFDTGDYILENKTYETACFRVFKGYHKASDFSGGIVAYDRIFFDEGHTDELAQTVEKLKALTCARYLKPIHFQANESFYYVMRPTKDNLTNVYLKKRRRVVAHKACVLLANVALIADELAQENIFDSFMLSDVMWDNDGTVFLADYGLRGSFVKSLGEHANIFVHSLAPETVSKRPHDEASAVYSLAVLAIKLIWGKPPFDELDPSHISDERERFLKNFNDRKLPPFLKDLLDMNVHNRPTLKEASKLFLDFSQVEK